MHGSVSHFGDGCRGHCGFDHVVGNVMYGIIWMRVCYLLSFSFAQKCAPMFCVIRQWALSYFHRSNGERASSSTFGRYFVYKYLTFVCYFHPALEIAFGCGMKMV